MTKGTDWGRLGLVCCGPVTLTCTGSDEGRLGLVCCGLSALRKVRVPPCPGDTCLLRGVCLGVVSGVELSEKIALRSTELGWRRELQLLAENINETNFLKTFFCDFLTLSTKDIKCSKYLLELLLCEHGCK